MAANNDLTKAAASLITDMVARAAMQQGQAPPSPLARRPSVPLPQTSPRAAELLNAILATRQSRPADTPQPATGVPGGFPDRASMLAANPNVVFQQGPMVAQQGQVQPTGAQEPTDPIQRYHAGLSPLDDQGQTFPNWESLPPDYKQQIWQQYAQQTGVDLNAAQVTGTPQYESDPNLRIRGNPNDPTQQTRQYAAPISGVDARAAEIMRNMPEAPAFQPSLTPSSPAMNDAAMLARIQAEQAPARSAGPRRRGGENIGEVDPYATLPPGTALTSERWAQLTPEQRQVAWEAAGLPNGNPDARATPAEQEASPPPNSGIAPEQWAGMTPEQKDAAWGVYYDPSIADTDSLLGLPTAQSIFRTIEEHTPTAIKELLTYDPTEDTGPGRSVARRVDIATKAAIEMSGWLEQQNQKQIADGAYYMMTHDGEMPSDWGDYGTYISRLLAGNALVPNKLSSIDYLKEHPELWDEATAAYDAGGSDGLIAWYEEQVGPWWAQASHLALDPLNWALGLAIPAKQLGARAAARTVAEEGATLSRGTRAMGAAGETLRFASDPLSYPFEQLFRGGKWLGKRAGRNLTRYGEQGQKRVGEELTDESGNIVNRIEGGQGSEEEANRLRAEQAQANADAQAKAAAKQAEADEKTLKAQQARDEQAAERQIKQEIAAGNKRRADELRARETAEKQRRAAEQKAAEDRTKRAAQASDIEAQRQLKLDQARISRDASIKQASTPKGRENAMVRHQAKVEAIEAEYKTKVGAWERAHGVSYADEVGEVARPVDTAPVPEPDVQQTTIYEEPRAGSNIDSIDQKQAEYDSMVQRRQAEREAAQAVTPEPTPDTTIAAPPERIAVDVEQNGSTVTKDYLDPDYVSKGAPDEPNLARLVRDVYGPSNPEAAAAFWDEYVPAAKRFMADDAALAEREAARIKAGGNVVSRDGMETAQRTVQRMEFNAQSDALFEMHFGSRSPRGTYRQFDVKTGPNAGRMHPTDPRSWIEHAVYGDNAADAEAAIAKIRNSKKVIIPGRTNDQVANWAERRANELFSDVRVEPRTAPLAAAPEPAPTSVGDVDPRIQRFVDDYRDDILSPDPNLSREAAREAHKSAGVNFQDRAMKKQANDLINQLRDESGHARGAKKGKPSQASGITYDPRDPAVQAAEKTRAGIGRVVDWVNPTTRRPVLTVGKATVKDHVVHADRLLEAWRGNVNLTQRELDLITEQVTITVGTGKNTRTITTNFWDSYIDNLDEASARRRGSYRKNGMPTTEEGWADEIKMMTEERDAALAKTKELFGDLYAPSKKNKLVKVTGKVAGTPRKYLQFNIVTGPRAIFNDIVTNEKFMFLTGQGGAIPKQQRLIAAMVKDDELDILEHPVFARVKNSGVTNLPSEIKHTIGREEVERTVTDRRFVLNPLNTIDSYLIKKVRGAGDNASRYAIYANYFDTHLIDEKAKFMNFVRGKVKKSGNEDLFNEIRDLVQRDFTADDVRAITRKYGADDSYARTWAKQVDDLSQAATAKQRQIMFSYKKTKFDDALGKAFLFHYYMTRSTALYTKLMLQHPQLIQMEAFIWEQSKQNLKNFPGAPEWMDGFIGFGMDHGHVMYTNPTMLVSGIGVLQSLGDGGFSDNAVEKVMSGTGLMIQPLLRAGFAAFGMGQAGDPTGTTQLRRAVISVYDKVRNSDYGKAHGWDKLTSAGPSRDFIQDIVNGTVDLANKIMREQFGAPIDDFNALDTKDSKMEQVKGIMYTNFQEEGGSNNPEEWPEDVYDRWIQASVDLEHGNQNEDVDKAADEYMDMAFEQTVGTVVSPVGAYVRDAQTDARQKRERDAGNVPYQDRTPEQAADVAVNDVESMQSPEAISLTAGMQRYNNAGTDNQEIVNSGYNQIIFGYEDIPDNYSATIGGKTYTGAQLKAMTDDEREKLANEYVAEESARAGIVQGARAGAGGTATADPLGTLKAERAAIKAEVPEVADYTKYRSYMLNDERDVRQVRKDALAVGTNTEFYKQHEEYRKYQISQGKTGEELEAAMDDWMTSDAAYLAVLGLAGRNKGGTGSSIYSATNPAPWREEKSPSTGGGSGNFPDSQTGEDIDAGIDFASLSVEDARDLIRTDSISPDGVEKLVDNGTVTTRILRQWIQDGTLLHDDLYQMAAQPNLTATDLKYMFEDGYLTMDDLIRLITDADEEFITEIRTENRRRKRARERKSEQDAKKSTSSGGYTPRGFFREYLGTPGS